MTKRISLSEFIERSAAGATVVDVREAYEYAESHVPGALFAPLSELERHLGDIPRGEDVFVICRSGSRSLTAADKMTAVGITAVSIDDGTLGWIEAGQPVESE